jgi:hypothetical protein
MSEELKQQFIEGEPDMKAAILMMCKTTDEFRELIGLMPIQQLAEVEQYLF